jgi:hypothetical protein
MGNLLGIGFSILSTPCACAVLLEQLKSPIFNLFNLFKKLPIIQLFENIWPRPNP